MDRECKADSSEQGGVDGELHYGVQSDSNSEELWTSCGQAVENICSIERVTGHWIRNWNSYKCHNSTDMKSEDVKVGVMTAVELKMSLVGTRSSQGYDFPVSGHIGRIILAIN